MSNDSAISRRRVPRREYQRKVGLLYSGLYSVVQAHEIGERGMLVATNVIMKKDERLVLTFQVPSLDQAVVRGIIRYLMPVEGTDMVKYGIEFENIDFEFKRQIRYYVASSGKMKKAS